MAEAGGECYEGQVLVAQCILRYENFIALNTFMIQKLYRTVDELNSRIVEFESKLNFMS